MDAHTHTHANTHVYTYAQLKVIILQTKCISDGLVIHSSTEEEEEGGRGGEGGTAALRSVATFLSCSRSVLVLRAATG